MGNWRKEAKYVALTAVAALGFVCGTACTGTVGVGYRAYDPYYRDYHAWGPDETIYYNRWLDETHRPHRDYRHLKRHDQREYWEWRHGRDDHRPGRR